MREAATSRSTGQHWIWSAGFALALAAVSLLVVQAYRRSPRARGAWTRPSTTCWRSPGSTPVRVDVNAAVAEAIVDAGLVQNPRAGIDIAELPAAHGDPVLLRQVWGSLLSNALKYSAPRVAAARIQVEGERDRDRDHVRYRVRDNGVGFDSRHAGKLFGMFQCLHAQDESGGTGVGLAIVQRIVARHRGQVSAHSEPGRGAEFTFELPTPSGNEVSA